MKEREERKSTEGFFSLLFPCRIQQPTPMYPTKRTILSDGLFKVQNPIRLGGLSNFGRFILPCNCLLLFSSCSASLLASKTTHETTTSSSALWCVPCVGCERERRESECACVCLKLVEAGGENHA